MSAPLPILTLYGRQGCHLCEEARAMLDALLGERRAAELPAPTVEERDIDADPALHDAFFETIPVVEVGHRRLELVTSRTRLARFLSDAFDGASRAEAADAARPGVTS